MGEEIDPFEAAMQELAGDSSAPAEEAAPADLGGGDIDPFEAAQAALGGDDSPPAAAASTAVAPSNLSAADQLEAASHSVDIDFLMDIKLQVSFEVGRAKMYIADLLSLGQGSVIELHRLVGEELEIYVNGHLLATGEVVVVNEKFGCKITGILSPEDRILRLAVVK